MRTINRIIASAVILSKDNKILMLKRNPKGGGVYLDYWQIPGGGVDKNETKIQTVIREIKEEVGIDISREKIEFINFKYKGKSEKILRETGERVLAKMDFNAYKIHISDKNSNEIKIQLEREFVEYKWFNLSEISNMKLASPSIALFRHLGYLI